MPRKSTRIADPAALVELLWQPSRAVGRTGVTVSAIVDAALQVADADGLDAVTMRRVAEKSGVGAMTLYSYVPGRPELVELMVDRMASMAYDGIVLPASREDWRAGIEHVAWSNWRLLHAHPWLVEVPASRPVLGPGTADKYEAELAPLDGIGLSDADMDHLLSAVLGSVTSAARGQLGLRRSREESGLDDAQWWSIVQPVMDEQIGAGSYPIASRVGETMASAGEPEEVLRRGLAWLLEGVAGQLG